VRSKEFYSVLAAFTAAILPTSGCRSDTQVPHSPDIPPLSIPEPSPPPFYLPSPEEIAANLADECAPSSDREYSSDEPRVSIATAGALPLVLPEPDFLSTAKDRCISGWVAFRFELSQDGSVENPELLTAYPKGVFDRPSLAALEKSRFNRATVSGDQVPGGCVVFLYHHPLRPLDAAVLAGQFPIFCPYPAPPTTSHGVFPRGPLKSLVPENPFTTLE